MPETIDAIAPFTGSPASKKAAAAPAPDQPTAPVEHAITLTQFGIELSRSEKCVELLNAFIFVENQAGRFKDTKSAYLARFAAFADQPVIKG